MKTDKNNMPVFEDGDVADLNAWSQKVADAVNAFINSESKTREEKDNKLQAIVDSLSTDMNELKGKYFLEIEKVEEVEIDEE